MSNRTEVSRDGIDVSRESVLSFAKAARYVGDLKGTKRVAFQTLFRWATKGCSGVVLETIRVGGSRCTSREALQRFFDALTAAREPGGHTPPPTGGGAGRGAFDPGDVDAVLRRAGIDRRSGDGS